MAECQFRGLAREDVNELQTFRIAIFQILQRLMEHDGLRALIAIDEAKAAAQLCRQAMREHRQDWRDAAAGCNHQAHLRLGLLEYKAAIRRHHIHFIACFQLLRRPTTEHPPFNLLDSYADLL